MPGGLASRPVAGSWSCAPSLLGVWVAGVVAEGFPFNMAAGEENVSQGCGLHCGLSRCCSSAAATLPLLPVTPFVGIWHLHAA